MGAFGWAWFAGLPERLQGFAGLPWEHQPFAGRPEYLQPGMPRPVGSGTGHAAVNLLPGRGAYTSTKEPGMPRRGMVTAGDFSFYRLLGPALEAEAARLRQRLASKPTAPGSSGSVTGDRGGSGAAPERADCDD